MLLSELQDKCRGAIVGGAVGDALGYEVEFLSLAAIRKRFGKKGISRYVLHGDGVALFSDDTQMSLFTLEGLMNGAVATNAGPVEAILPYIEKAYLSWYRTQTEGPKPLPGSWLGNIRALWARRAPGITCMGALENIAAGCLADNNSKGCGGAMRVAPIGLFCAAHSDIYTLADAARLAGLSAEITHKHIASTFASALLAAIVMKCIQACSVDRAQLFRIVEDSLAVLGESFPNHGDELLSFESLVRRALELGRSDVDQNEAILELGEGWVGDEAVAIAIFSAMRHIDSFEDCIVCAVNHDGDSDSTGAIAGNIIGAILGYSAIPACYLDTLEISPVLVSASDDLSSTLSTPRLTTRYHNHLPDGVAGEYLI